LARNRTGKAKIVTDKTLRINEALRYFSALSLSPFARKSEIKFIIPAEIPISEAAAIIATRLLIAEKTPKSETLKARATKRVKRNPKKAETKFPEKRIYVSLALWDLARPTARSIYALISQIVAD